ncbi:uncharacterized protein LOC132752378 [Ruditapes philippinarum]|uniref:uncharacterized protein LOC132752378 n=1 Tax=Ruditapes philippinarum TaxID=129788 RepID=UPI00295B00C1|nr:uncharacterized protein LOC132752378 [Ruditapes philippinarum]
MSCGFSEIGLKENMDAVGESITHFARSFDRHTVETRQILQKLFQLLQVSICDDADSKEIMKLTRDYVTSETDLDTEKNATLARIDTLLQTLPDKKKYKDGSSYSIPGRKILEEYLKEPKQELPILSAVADNKERQEKGKTKLMENALAPLNKPTAKEEERMVKRWSKDSTKEKLSDNHGKQREYKLESKNVEIKKLHFTVDQTKKETESLKFRVSGNMVFDKKVFDNIRAENERLKREKEVYKLKKVN